MKKIAALVVIAVGELSLFSSAQVVWPRPVIKEVSSAGGHTSNKTGPSDLMYLVKGGDKITFTVKAEGADEYVWQVNKVVQKNAKGNTFTWTVPKAKGIWEIHVQVGGAYRELEKQTSKVDANRMARMQQGIVQHRWGGAHVEWVISTLSKDEAPAVFEYFADGKYQNRTEADPWGRKLPEWRGKLHGVEEGFASIKGSARIPSKTAFGTWRWRHKFIDPFYAQVGGTISLTYISRGSYPKRDTYNYGEDMDAHHHCCIEHPGVTFSIEYDGAGSWDEGKWHQITIVRTRDGHVYAFRDGILEMHAIDPIPESSDTLSLFFRQPNNTRLTGLPPTRGPAAFDCLEVYDGKYLFPISGVEHGQYVSKLKPVGEYPHLLVMKKGILIKGRAMRLEHIAASVDKRYFRKTGKNTYTCYTNLIVDDGAELIIKNETLLFHCETDGQLEFGQNFGSTLRIENSTIGSDSEHYFVWNNCAPDTHPIHKLWFYQYPWQKDRDIKQLKVYRLNTCDASGYFTFIVKNSTIRNTTKMYIDSPMVLHMENTRFENICATDTGIYSKGGGIVGYRYAIKGKKSFWVVVDDLNVHDFTLRGLTFRGKNDKPIEIAFLLNALRDRFNIYDVDVGNGSIVVKDIPIPNENQSHTWIGYCHLKGTLKTAWMDGKVGLVNCRFKDIKTLATPGKGCNAYAIPKYYLDVKVVNPGGTPVKGAKVSVTIDKEIGLLASTKARKYGGYYPPSSIPKGFDLNSVWTDPEYSPENMEVRRPLATGKYRNFYHLYRFVAGQKITSTFTGPDGHTPLPRDKKHTMILADFVQDKNGKREFTYTITVEKDGKGKVIKGVNPGPEWYRPDPNRPTYTIVAVLDGKTVTEAQLKKAGLK